MVKTKNQSGFHVVLLLVIVATVALIIFIGWRVLGTMSATSQQSATVNQDSSGSNPNVDPNDPNKAPLAIKHIGIELGYYAPTTNKAGDIVFTKTGLEAYGNLLFFDYGAVAEANSAAQRRLNPQPTFIVPLGTKIHSLVDGVVVNVPTLYSNDYSIQVASSSESSWLYETEHVINPAVKVGDKVTAGQVIAEASTHDSQYHPGFGLYEIGILHAGNPPEHVCPFNYLDDSIRDDVFAKITDLYKSWEAYWGDDTLYDESKHVVPGCYTLDEIEG